MEDRDQANAAQPLIMRSYRRHRRQARWGTWSLFVPLASFFWVIFWYLMMKQPSLPGSTVADNSSSWLVMLVGTGVLEIIGIALAVTGLLDTYHKHAHAAIGLAINAFIFIAAMIILAMRLFSQSVG